MKKSAVWFGVLVLLSCLFFQVVLSMRTKSPTCDEFYHHIANGYSYLLTGDFRMNPASPPLPRLLAGIPLYFLGAKAPFDHYAWKKGDSPEFARQFFCVYNRDTDRLVFWARMPIVLISLVFALTVFIFAKRLFGAKGGLAALALYVFCPDILAHSGLATADLCAAFFIFLTLMQFAFYLSGPSLKNLALTGFFAGLAFLSKFSAIVIFPILILSALMSGQLRAIAPKKTLVFFLICFLTVWAGYFFELKPLLKNTPDPAKKEAIYRNIGGPVLVQFAREVPVPLSTFSSAFVSMMHTRAAGTNAYLMGEWSRTGWWYYYFIAFAIKNTIPFILLSILSLLMIRKLKLYRILTTVFCVPTAFFFVATLGDKAQAGIRYFLPIYPLLFVLAGGTVAFLWDQKNKILRCAAVILLSWHAAEAFYIYPNYLAYFNEWVGGPSQGHKYLRDSNLDWGQDLKEVVRYVKDSQNPEIVYLGFTSDYLKSYGVRLREPSEHEIDIPDKELYVVGAHFMDGLKWTKRAKPDKIIGHSIFIYDFRHL